MKKKSKSPVQSKIKLQKEFQQRKADHIKYALDERTQNLASDDFHKIKLIHCALPEINLSEVSLKTQLLGYDFLSPHFISSMTAGHAASLKINQRLAEAASDQSWLMAVGSQRRELNDDSALQEWKKIKKSNPKTQFISNIGLEELLKQPLKNILKLTESLESIGLYVHLNPLQEAFQNKDQAQFKNGLKAIENLCKEAGVPILVKEVGFGLSKAVVQKLFSVGVSVVDVAGRGGTNWSVLEGLRDQTKQAFLNQASQAFAEWGMSAVECLIQSQSLVKKHSFWVSGGFRNGVHSLKGLCLGAHAVGIAQPLMKSAVVSTEKVILEMQRFDYELKVGLFGVGVKSPTELADTKVWHCDNICEGLNL